ncbi:MULTISPECIES: hypothetical protein [Aerosakkonema]|uniref:hypothetical protein n=1 Tax=Aerosakkonema TaxID=1246629 RepID=UPI0035B7902D
MTEKPQPPSIEKVKERSARVQEICKRADANIMVLDEIIAQLEEENRRSPLYQSRLRRAKRLLNFPEENAETVESDRNSATTNS